MKGKTTKTSIITFVFVVGSNTIQNNYSLENNILKKKQGHITLPRCVTLDNSANFATVELGALRNPASKTQNAWQPWMQFLLEKVLLVSLSTCIISFIFIYGLKLRPAAGERANGYFCCTVI